MVIWLGYIFELGFSRIATSNIKLCGLCSAMPYALLIAVVIKTIVVCVLR